MGSLISGLWMVFGYFIAGRILLGNWIIPILNSMEYFTIHSWNDHSILYYLPLKIQLFSKLGLINV